ncbi:MAG: hypothetical protein AAFZ07_30105, partial [Actinomycetota bacterium]
MVVTELPTLGSGAVASVEAAGDDLWVTGAEVFRPRHLGAHLVLSAADGQELGTYAVSQLDAAGRVRLGGAQLELGGDVALASTWRGEYRFDSVALLNGAGLTATDPIVGPSVVFEGETEVAGTISATDVVVKAGATLRPAPGFNALRFDVSGTLTIE